jgi:hypothetical protein
LLSPSSLILVKLISVEKRRDSAFLGALVAVYILSRLQLHLPFECIYFFKKENEYQRFFSGLALVSKQVV